jgi:hypothetical protein
MQTFAAYFPAQNCSGSSVQVPYISGINGPAGQQYNVGQVVIRQTGGVAPLPLSGTTGSIGGSALTAGQCASGTASVANSTASMAVAVSPATYPGDGYTWQGYISAAGTVTVKVCAISAGTPTASAYNVRVIQ